MKIQSILRNVLLVGVFGSLLVPFVVLGDLYFPFITGKAYVFRILVEVLFGVWIVLALLNPEYRLKKSFTLWSIISFLIVVLIANLQGLNPYYSFWSNYERMEGYITLIHLFAYFVIVASVLNTKNLWNYFWNGLVAVSFGHGIYAILQKFNILSPGTSVDRIDTTFGNASYLGVFMLMSFFITLYLLFKNNSNKWLNYFYIITIVLQVITIFLTATRGTILALLGGVFLSFLIMAFLEPQRKVIKLSLIGVISGLIVFSTVVFGFKESSLVQNNVALRRISEISFESGTVLARFINWSIAWKAIENKPLLGYGQGNYGLIFDVNYDSRMWNQEQWFDRVHNIFLDWLVASGFLGLIAYLSMTVSILYYLWKKEFGFSNVAKATFTSLLAAYFVHNLFVFDSLTSYMIFFLILAFIHSRVSKHFEFCNQKIFSKTIIVVVSVIVVILTPFTVWAVNYSSLNQNYLMMKAIRPTSINDIDKSIELFNNSFSNDSFGNSETRFQLLVFASTVLRAKGGDIQEKQELANLVGEQIKKQIENNPSDSRLLMMSGQFVAQAGNLELAKDLLNRAILISPDKQILYLPLIEILHQQGKNKEVIDLIKQVYEIEKNNDLIWKQYVKSSLRVGNQELYKQLIDEAYNTNKGYRVVMLAEENLNSKPNEVQSYASLAVAHYRNGDSVKAIDTLKILIDKFPEGKSQAELIIKKIEAGESIF